MIFIWKWISLNEQIFCVLSEMIRFFNKLKNIWMKTGYILMDFSVIFPMQLSEFIRSMNFGSNMKKNCIQKKKIHLKIEFFEWRNYFLIYNNVYSDRSELYLSNETIIIQKFHFSRKLWWKSSWKLTKLLPCGNAHNFQTKKDINSQF